MAWEGGNEDGGSPATKATRDVDTGRRLGDVQDQPFQSYYAGFQPPPAPGQPTMARGPHGNTSAHSSSRLLAYTTNIQLQLP